MFDTVAEAAARHCELRSLSLDDVKTDTLTAEDLQPLHACRALECFALHVEAVEAAVTENAIGWMVQNMGRLKTLSLNVQESDQPHLTLRALILALANCPLLADVLLVADLSSGRLPQDTLSPHEHLRTLELLRSSSTSHHESLIDSADDVAELLCQLSDKPIEVNNTATAGSRMMCEIVKLIPRYHKIRLRERERWVAGSGRDNRPERIS